MNNTTLLLIAQRKALGLNMTELAELPNIEQDRRVIADYESERRKPADSYNLAMFQLSGHYELLLRLVLRDIDAHYFKYPLPVTDDADVYFERMKSLNHLVLPYFMDFEQFKRNTGNESKTYWRIWQAVVGHLAAVGKVLKLNDDILMPDSFTNSKYWLAGGYEIELEDDFNGQRD